MTVEPWARVKEILYAALELDAQDRSAYLDQACAGDLPLRQEVDSLILSHSEIDEDFLEDIPLRSIDGGSVRSLVGRSVGPYRIVEELGSGGMGDVYRAVRDDDQYQKQVAIKVVRRGFDTDSGRRRFKAERQILASLDHPNIARLLDSGSTEDGLPYVVMELVEGMPIDEYCDRHKFSLFERLQLFRVVCATVHYAHQHLVVHRDLKPGNILVTEEGVPKLLDFGIAKLLAPEMFAQPLDRTATAMRVMTPEFASPEQVRGQAITTASDVYSLGVVLYRLLTGRSPYRTTSEVAHEIAREICEVEPRKPSIAVTRPVGKKSAEQMSVWITAPVYPGSPDTRKLRRRLAGDLDNIVLMALRKEPGRRYASVAQFADDIRRHLEGLPVMARKDTLTYRAGKFVTRHKVGVTGAALIIVLLVASMAMIIREGRVARVQRARAEQHFNDLRRLANSLMFEVHDAIENLPGSTPARQLLVKNALQYLDGLARETGDDVSLQRELATAYERIGRVQGDPESSNLGDTGGAVESFGKALSIREKLVDPRSTNNPPDLIALAASYREMCGMNARYLGNIGRALDYCSRALSIVERLSQTDPSNPVVKVELAKVYEATGRVYGQGSTEGNAGDSYKALESHRKALHLVEELSAASPGDLNLSNWHGNLGVLTADDLFEIGKVAEAVPLYQESTRTFEKLAGESNNVRYLDALDMAYQRMGDMQLVNGHFAQAIPFYRKQLEVAQRLVAADPKSLSFRNSLAASYATYGHALWRSGRVPEGLAALRHGLKEIADSGLRNSKAKGLEIIQRFWLGGGLEKGGNIAGALDNYLYVLDAYVGICASDPKDLSDCVMVAGLRDRVARIYIQKGRLDEARIEYQKAQAYCEPLSGGLKPNLEALYTVVNIYYGMGETSLSQARRTKTPEKKTQLWREALHWYEQSLAAQSRIPGWLPITPNELDARTSQEIGARISLCQSALGHMVTSGAETAAVLR